jgi:hypothetical protein
LKAVADTLRWVDEMLMRAKKTGRWELLPKGYDLRIEFLFEAGHEATRSRFRAERAGHNSDTARRTALIGYFIPPRL